MMTIAGRERRLIFGDSAHPCAMFAEAEDGSRRARESRKDYLRVV